MLCGGDGEVQIPSRRRIFKPWSPCGVGLGDALQLAKEGLADVMRLFRAPEASTVPRMRGGAASDHFGHHASVQVELFASADCLARCFN